MDANEVKAMLSERAEDVCRHLLPGGRREGSEWRAGSLNGEKGDSLGVNMNGKKGVWCDFASGEKGDNLLELWIQVRGIQYREALAEAQRWLGVPDRADAFHPIPRQPKPMPSTDYVSLRAGGEVEKYLLGRKLSPKAMAAYGVAETQLGKGIVFPFTNADGTVVHVKRLALERVDGKKQISTSKGTQLCLFGKHACNGAEVTICEGEIDALSLASIGAPAVSVPNGAQQGDGHNAWIENDWPWLESFQRINILMDMDEPGQKSAAVLIERLGKERCHLVQLPDGFKDPNEMLMAGKIKELCAALIDAKGFEPSELKNAEAYREDTWNEIARKDTGQNGHDFLWSGFAFKVRAGELTIWTGFSGHGKSAMLLHLMVFLASKGEKNCIASLEIKPTKTLEILTRQSLGMAAIGRRDFDEAMNWMSDSFWIFNHVGTKDWKEMLQVFRYARRRYACSQFVIDSLLKCGIGSEDYETQKAFVSACADFCNETGAHIHLVAHSKKKEDETKMPGKLDVKGCSEITDIAFNGLTVWRNKAKEEKMYNATAADDEQAWIKASGEHDGIVQVWKQRETGDEPNFRVFFDKNVQQFTLRPNEAKRYVPI